MSAASQESAAQKGPAKKRGLFALATLTGIGANEIASARRAGDKRSAAPAPEPLGGESGGTWGAEPPLCREKARSEDRPRWRFTTPSGKRGSRSERPAFRMETLTAKRGKLSRARGIPNEKTSRGNLGNSRTAPG